MSARGLATFLFRHQRKLLATTALSLAMGGTWVHERPVLWRAEATLLVEAGRADGARALAAMLESGDLHAQVLDLWGDRLYPALPADVRAESFARDLEVIPADGAGLVRLGLRGTDGAQATGALTTLLDRLAEKNRTVFAVAPDPALAAQAVQARDTLAAFRKRAGLGEGAIDKAALLKRRAELEGEQAAAEAEATALTDRLAVMKARLATTPATIEISAESERSKVAEDARAKLFELQTREAELLGKYQDGSVFIQNLRAEKRKVEELLGKLDTATPNRVVNGANPLHQELEKDSVRAEAALSAARARAKTAGRQLGDLDRRLELLSGAERGLAELERAAALAEARLGPANVPAAAIDGIGIVQSAKAGSRPIGPSPAQVLALAGGFGALAGLLLAALAQIFSSRLSSAADIERRLGLPVLTSIPRES